MTNCVKRKISVGVIAILIVIAFIWIQSCFNVKASSAQSRAVLDWIKDTFQPFLGDYKLTAQGIRKFAHFVEFFILGGVAAAFFINFRPIKTIIWKVNTPAKSFMIRTVVCVASIFLVACIDEFIQIFSGRGSRFSDVLLDFASGTAAIAIFVIVKLIVYAIKNHSKTC